MTNKKPKISDLKKEIKTQRAIIKKLTLRLATEIIKRETAEEELERFNELLTEKVLQVAIAPLLKEYEKDCAKLKKEKEKNKKVIDELEKEIFGVGR